VQINIFRPSPSHSKSDSQFFRFAVKIFSRAILAGGWGVVGENIFSPEPKPALGGPDGDYFSKHCMGCSL